MLVGDGWAYIHIAKCGGTTIRSVLKGHEVSDVLPLFPDHTVSHPYHWIARERPEGFVFCTVRHPAKWLRSYWGERRAEKVRSTGGYLDRLWSDDCNQFIRQVCLNAPGYVGRMYEAYMPWPIEAYKAEHMMDALAKITDAKPAIRNARSLPEIDADVMARCERVESRAVKIYREAA